MSKALTRFAGPTVCPQPEYGAVLGSDVVLGLVELGFVAAGGAAGYLVSGRSKTAGVVGAVAGGVIGIVPALLAQRATVRSVKCPNPSLGRLLAYAGAKTALGGLVGFATRSLAPNSQAVPAAASAAVFLGAPAVLGKPILRTAA